MSSGWILLLLWDKNGRTQKQIADAVGKDKGTISPRIDGPEKRSLIVRVPDTNDRRLKRIWLTPGGAGLDWCW